MGAREGKSFHRSVVMDRVPLHRRDGTIDGYAVVDPADYVDLSKYSWHLSRGTGQGYVVRTTPRDEEGRQGKVRMGRHLLGLAPGDSRQVDHINGDRRDHRRANLRILTGAQNMQNQKSHAGSSSRFRGVYWDKHAKKWRADAGPQSSKRYLGYFDSEEEAARVAREAREGIMPYAHEREVSTVMLDGSRITPGTEDCKCDTGSRSCEFPCWQRVGLTTDLCCPDCAPL